MEKAMLQAEIAKHMDLSNGKVAARVTDQLRTMKADDPRWLLVDSALSGDLNRDGKISSIERLKQGLKLVPLVLVSMVSSLPSLIVAILSFIT